MVYTVYPQLWPVELGKCENDPLEVMAPYFQSWEIIASPKIQKDGNLFPVWYR